jgi:hypothetical protein
MHQGSDGAFMRRGAPSRHQGDSDTHAFSRAALSPQPMERFKQRLEWSRVERLVRSFGFMTLERIQPLSLKHSLGLVREQDCVAVKGNPDFARVATGSARRVRKYQRARKAGL